MNKYPNGYSISRIRHASIMSRNSSTGISSFSSKLCLSLQKNANNTGFHDIHKMDWSQRKRTETSWLDRTKLQHLSCSLCLCLAQRSK